MRWPINGKTEGGVKMKNNKLIYLVLMILMLCWSAVEAKSAKTSVAPVNKQKVALQKTYTIKFSINQPATKSSYLYVCARRFAERAYDLSNGQLVVQIYPGAVLGNNTKVIEQLQMNTIQGTSIATPDLVGFAPQLQIFSLPYLLTDLITSTRAINSPAAWDIWNTAGDKMGLKILGAFNGGFRGITNNVRSINSISDFKGLKLRVPQTPILMDTIKSLGASPVSIAGGSEVFSALQAGTIDGQESSLDWAYGQGFAEIQKYATITNHSATITPIFFNKDFYNSLPPNLQAALKQATVDAAEMTTGFCLSQENSIETMYKGKGVKVTYINIDEARKAVAPVWEKYAGACGGMDNINKLADQGKMPIKF